MPPLPEVSMSDTLQAISRSLSNDVQTLSTVSHNVANMHTPGYRAVRAVPEFRPDTVPGSAAVVSTAIDQRDGALAQTGGQLDIALRGEGFFVVERNGQMLLTRAGALQIDSEGRLSTVAGDLVVGDSGVLQMPAGKVRFQRDGQVFVEDNAVGQLQVVAVGDPARLRPAGNGVYAYDGPLAEWKGSIVQGAIEHANVDVAEETVRLMELTRHAESVQRAISIYDKAMDTGINQIGGN
jgi:flagellar basal-body rod protein FlgF